MFVILTSRDGQYRTELVEGMRPCETYDYLLCGEKRARFVIAELEHDVRVRVIDEAPPALVNEIPSKFFEKFETVDGARHRLQDLVSFTRLETSLSKVA